MQQANKGIVTVNGPLRSTNRIWSSLLAASTATLLCVTPSLASAAAVNQSSSEQQVFAAAAQEFGVPQSVLQAISYNESRWESQVGMSVDGGYGVMDLRTAPGQIQSGRDGSMRTPAKQPADYYTLDQAAALLHEPASVIKSDVAQNIRGGAAVLSYKAKQLNDGKLPASINDWYGIVATYNGAADSQIAGMFADDVFSTIKSGASSTTSTGQQLSMAANATVQPNRTLPASAGFRPLSVTPPTPPAECPSSLNCRFIPAAYAQDDPNDPTNYGNYDPANRPADMKIKYIFIHDIEGSYNSAIEHFQDPTAYDSAQYVISSQGDITQMVKNSDVSWGVGNWNLNPHGINIEHEGFAAQGSTWYTEAMYRSSATLVRWLAAKYHIPLDRQHVIAHGDLDRFPTAWQAIQHWDPGPFWDWNHYMALLHEVNDQTEAQMDAGAAADAVALDHNSIRVGRTVAISPKFTTNKPALRYCGIVGADPCLPLPLQPSNMVLLHTQPSNNSPLLSDPWLHPDNAPGTNIISDWSAVATTGFRYTIAKVQGDWTGVWFAGRIGWFYNPRGTGQTAHTVKNMTVKVRPGLNSAPVYPNAFPEASAYPADIPAIPLVPAYQLPAGQTYPTSGLSLPADYYYDATIDYSLPNDHAIVHGDQKYYQISFNHHIGFVKAEDVVLNN